MQAVNQIETTPLHQPTFDQDLMRGRGVQIESWAVRRGQERPVHQRTPQATSAPPTTSPSRRWFSAGSRRREVVVIPKSVKPDRIAQNLDAFDFLSDEQMQEIATLDTGVSQFFDQRDPATVSWLGERRVD